MVFKVSLHDNSRNQSIVLSNVETTVIGRGFFECQDKRVSKRHGEITVLDANIKIKSCHNNPIFYKLKDEHDKKVLRKDSEIVLGDSDIFSLLPNEFEWIIKVEQNETENGQNQPTSTFRIRQTDEINANLTQLLQEGRMTPDLERTPSPDNLRGPENTESNIEISSTDVSSSSRKRSCDDSGKTENSEAKKMKQADPSQVPSSTTSDTQSASAESNSDTIPLKNIKPDPDHCSTVQSTSATCSVKQEPIDSCTNQQPTSSSCTSNVKTESDDNPSCQVSSNLRQSCEFGIRCFRMTDEHRREYAHPMDCDYRRPNFPPAPSDAPRCPYWDACYRRNPEHFREFVHPSSDQYVAQRPAQVQIQIQHIVPPPVNQQPRNRNRNRNRNIRQYDDDDIDDFLEEDEDVLFGDGDDSDIDPDFENSQPLSEDDLEDEENNLEE